MKLLLLSLNYAPELTGIGKFNGELCDWLARRGHQVRVITAPPYYPEWSVHPGYRGWRFAAEHIGAVRVTRCPIYVPAKVTALRRLLLLASFALSSIPPLLWQALTWHPEVVMVTEPPLAAVPMALLAATSCGGRTVLHVQDLEIDAAFELGLLRGGAARRGLQMIERWLMRSFDVVSTISVPMAERLIAKGLSRAKVVLIPNWADVETVPEGTASETWRRKFGLAPGDVILLYAGNLGMKQGLDTLLAAARQLRHRTNIRFVFCGEGAGRAALQAAAVDLPNVSFVPLQPLAELAAMLAAADIHLLPQRAGAADLVMPSKLGNILASGRPVIVGAGPGTQLHAAVATCGVAVPPEDVPALVGAIEHLAASAEVRQILGEKARLQALAHWNRTVILQDFERLVMNHRAVAELDGDAEHAGKTPVER